MSLTTGTGPFGQAPAGRFNIETPDKGAIPLDVIPRRVRGLNASPFSRRIGGR